VTQKCRWSVFDSVPAVAEEVADRISREAARSISKRCRFRLVLAGGRTPEHTYRLLSERSEDWARWEIFFGDERCLPASHPERNSRMAAETWLDQVAVPAENIHPIHAEKGAERAAAEYAALIMKAVPFDMVILGMGEDGHTASLFPGHVHPGDEWVHAIHHAPKPPPDRVSLSARVLSSTRKMLVLVTGQSKAEAVRRWHAGDDRLPVSRLTPEGGVDVLLDQLAAVGLDRPDEL